MPDGTPRPAIDILQGPPPIAHWTPRATWRMLAGNEGRLALSIPLIVVLLATSVATSFLSGIFGMAGGMILMGVLLALLSVPEAMALHAIAQVASNGWRGLLWVGHVRWRPVAAYMSGCAVALAALSLLQFMPSKPLSRLMLGVSPFLVRLLPQSFKPDPQRLVDGVCYGAACMSLMLLA